MEYAIFGGYPNNINMVKMLLNNGYDVNHINKYSKDSALNFAVSNRYYPDIVKLLLQQGAKVNYPELGTTPMFTLLMNVSYYMNNADRFGPEFNNNVFVDIARLLINAGVDLNFKRTVDDKQNITALAFAEAEHNRWINWNSDTKRRSEQTLKPIIELIKNKKP